MKLYKKSTLIVTILSALLLTSVFADDVLKVDVDEAASRVIDLDFSIYSMKLKITDVDEAIRKADYASDSLDYSLHKYKVFRDIYYYDESRYDAYLDMDSSSLTERYAELMVKKMNVAKPPTVIIPSGTDPEDVKKDYYEELEDDITFINGIFMFGNSKPELTDDKLYSDFLKNSEFAVSSAEYEKEKLLTNIKYTENLISSQISKLYKGILNIQFSRDMSKDMLIFKKENLLIVEKNYKLGLISKLDYESQYVAYQKSLLEYKNLVYTYINLDLELKNKLKMASSDSLILVDDFSSRYNENYTSIKEYKELAKSSDTFYNIMLSDLDMLNARFDLYKKYNTSTVMDEYKDFVFDISQLSENIEKEEYNIEFSVDYALSDIIIKDVEVKKANNAYEISKIVYESSKQKQEVGLISEINLSSFKLDMKSKKIVAKTAARNYENSKYLFDQLINHGIKYY